MVRSTSLPPAPSWSAVAPSALQPQICSFVRALGAYASWIGILSRCPTFKGSLCSTESDARDALPKAVAAERNLRAINSDVQVEGVIAAILGPRNAEELLSGFPLILDGTDNFETRFLINDFAVKSGTPWIYAAAVASYGVSWVILPGKTACLACLLDSSANAGLEETCDTIGVLGPIVNLVASLEVAEAMKLLSGRTRGAPRPPSVLRCMERTLPIHSSGAQFAVPRLHSAPVFVSWRVKRNRTSPCAAGIPCRFTNAAALST